MSTEPKYKVTTMLELIRRARKINRRKLAAMSGVSYMSIFNAERKGYNLRKTNIDKIAKALDVNPHVLYFECKYDAPADGVNAIVCPFLDYLQRECGTTAFPIINERSKQK